MRQFSEGPPVEKRVGEALTDRDATLSVAESCTGGLVGSLVTDLPGASAYFDRSYVAYTYDAKRDLLGVSREALESEGAVSERVGRQMAAGARERAGATWGLSTTGVAGPEQDRSEKPVGTVYVGVARPVESEPAASTVAVERYQFDGTRTEIKARVARRALADLLDHVQRD